MGYWRVVAGMWENRFRRLFHLGSLQNRKVKKRVREWMAGGKGRKEVGEACLVDEMQVIEPHGWLHA